MEKIQRLAVNRENGLDLKVHRLLLKVYRLLLEVLLKVQELLLELLLKVQELLLELLFKVQELLLELLLEVHHLLLKVYGLLKAQEDGQTRPRKWAGGEGRSELEDGEGR